MAATMTQRFDAFAFLSLARELAAHSGDEAKLRTAVGRAYYALFLVAREKTNVREKRGAHQTVINTLRRQSGSRAIADQLDRLRRLRHLADYDMFPADPTDRDWARNWSQARTIVDWLLPKLQTL